MYGLAINTANFTHLFKKVDFYAIVDHLALTHIIKSKAEATTTRLKRLLEVFSPFSFNLYYIKGKDMILNDFFSRQKHDNSDQHEIVPISFNMWNILHNMHFSKNKKEQGKYLVQTRLHVTTSGTILPKVHSIDKGIDPNVRPEKQLVRSVVTPLDTYFTWNKIIYLMSY